MKIIEVWERFIGYMAWYNQIYDSTYATNLTSDE